MKTDRFALIMLIALTAFVATLQAETKLGGELSQSNFHQAGNPYLVEEDLIIPQGEEVVVGEGCVFLFKAFTGIRVTGKLVVEGTSQNPVIFTSMYDKEFNDESKQLANPFDWNGIFIAQNSDGAILRNFQLRYSVYGVKSQNEEIIIQNARFRQNGQLHFTVDEKIQYVQDDIPFSYGSRELNSENGSESTSDKKSASTKGKSRSPRRTVRMVSLGTGVVGAALGATLGVMASQSYQQWGEAQDVSVYNQKQSEFNGRLAGSIAFGTLGLLGLSGFGITFVF